MFSIHTHTRVMHKHTPLRSCTHTYTHNTRTRPALYVFMLWHSHAHILTSTHSHAHVLTSTHSHAHIPTSTRSHTHVLTSTHSHAHILTSTHSHAHSSLSDVLATVSVQTDHFSQERSPLSRVQRSWEYHGPLHVDSSQQHSECGAGHPVLGRPHPLCGLSVYLV